MWGELGFFNKEFMKQFVQTLLKRFAARIVEVNQPKVVAITGSVGKTSTRNAIAALCEAHFQVRTNKKNYNNEFGIPLTIIGEMSPGKSAFGWAGVLWRAWRMSLKKDPNYPNLLVLEFGVDHPGDIAYLCEIAKPDVAVLTAISPVHLEHFGTLEKLMEEKGSLLQCVSEKGVAIFNADDAKVVELASKATVPTVSYSMKNEAGVFAKNIGLTTREDFSFEPGELFSQLSFEVSAGDEEEAVVLQNRLGKGAVQSLLAAVAVGKALGLSLSDMTKAVSNIKAEPGRMHPIAGIKGSLLLDDSYNAAPASMRAGLQVLKMFSVEEEARRIAALGAMGELGSRSEDEHRMIGMRCAEGGVDVLVCVGERARDIRRSAIEAGFSEEKTQYFSSSKEAGRWLDQEVKKGDIVFIKGSQSARMEYVTKDLMAEPMRAKELLVRQEESWLIK